MINNEDKKIEDLIKDAYNEKVWLPEFQRPFVWDNSQIRLLVDSLYHNYTISSILSWNSKNWLGNSAVNFIVDGIVLSKEKTDVEEKLSEIDLIKDQEDIFIGRLEGLIHSA